jgi:GntR family transcriptional regulator/MocR family aminotransferase
MPKQTGAFDIAAIAPDDNAATSRYQQLYENLREAILTGRLAPGTRLPATRVLAGELGLARNTVVNAFEQLAAEGYLESRPGDGTYVSRALPDERLTVKPPRRGARRSAAPVQSQLSRQSQALAAARLGVWGEDGPPCAFRPDLLALDHFPLGLWARLVSRNWRHSTTTLLGYGDPAGYRPLREAVASYLGAARGVRCTPEQIFITNGAQQGIDLAVRTLLDPGDKVWVENPGYRGVRGALIAAGAQLMPVLVDNEGLQVESGMATAPQARAVYVTPSHQYPTGATLSLARRLALLEWAQRTGAWIIEDDYDSEYRYTGRPLSSLHGLDAAERVIYIGTFSKVLFPALRLGYLVAPQAMVDAITRLRALTDRQSPTVDQAVLADFISEGHFARHIRRMRVLYGERQSLLVDGVRRQLGGCLEIVDAEAGLHVVGWLPPGVDDREISQAAAAVGIDAQPLTANALAPLARGGLVLGYAALDEAAIQEGVRRLCKALNAVQ